jgi:uncharacterized protein involved in exopolysaccharide biosynthesis
MTERLRTATVHTVDSSPAFSGTNGNGYLPVETAHPSKGLNYSILLWRNRRMLGRVTAIGATLTLMIAFLIPNSYESSTRLMAPDMHGGGSEIAMVAGLLAKAGGGAGGLTSSLLGGMNNAGALFVGVLHSRTIADDLVNKFDLRKVYWVKQEKDARDKLAERTDISEDKKSGIITIAVSDHSPQRATEMALAYVDELNALLAQVNTSSAHRERVFLEDRLKIVRQELDVAAKQLGEFSSKNAAIDPRDQGKAMMEAAVSLQSELIASETELRGLQEIYTDNNVRVRSLKARISELSHQVEKLRGPESEQTASTGETAEEALYPSFRKLPTLGVTYADLYREVKLREAVFEILTQQYEMAKVAEAKEIPSVKVMDPADFPEKKSGPHRSLILLLGVLGSLAFGSAFVIGRSAWEQADPQDPRKQFAMEMWKDTQPAYFQLQNRLNTITSKLHKDPKQS